MSKPKNIIIIEPHYDDAWINLGGYILKHPKMNFKILSISYDGFNKDYETQKLSEILPNVKTKALKLRGIHWNLIHRIKKENYLRYFLKINNLRSLSDLLKTIEKECTDQNLAILPLGTLHPQHVVFFGLKLNIPTKWYIEWPYCYEEQGSFDKFMDRAEVVDISDVIDRKIRIFTQVYKSQFEDLLVMIPKHGTLLSKRTKEIIIPSI